MKTNREMGASPLSADKMLSEAEKLQTEYVAAASNLIELQNQVESLRGKVAVFTSDSQANRFEVEEQRRIHTESQQAILLQIQQLESKIKEAKQGVNDIVFRMNTQGISVPVERVVGSVANQISELQEQEKKRE